MPRFDGEAQVNSEMGYCDVLAFLYILLSITDG